MEMCVEEVIEVVKGLEISRVITMVWSVAILILASRPGKDGRLMILYI